MTRSDMNCQEKAAEYRKPLPMVAGWLGLWLVTACIPSVAGAENAAELGHSIRRLTRPVAESVRSVIQSNRTIPEKNVDPVKEENGTETSKGGISPASDGDQLSRSDPQ